jgi:hypothetical protein
MICPTLSTIEVNIFNIFFPGPFQTIDLSLEFLPPLMQIFSENWFNKSISSSVESGALD